MPRRRIWPFVLSGCAVVFVMMVAACGGLMYFGFRQVTGEGEVAVEFDQLFEEIAEGRGAEFYRARGSAELKRTTREAEFVSFCQNLNERLGKLRSKTMSGFFVRTQNLTTYVDAAYKGQFERGEATVKTGFKHDNGQWLLNSFHVESPELLKGTVRDKCPHCGEPYEPGAKFCPHCGKELVNRSDQTSEINPP
jgi:predicted RNA-binding Zn-ribbon protein involved in translation (DUF1610 family)